MFIDLSKIKENDVIAVALSGGSDSMALLFYLLSVKDKYNFTVKAINVEHGIRGEESIKDSQFVKDYCERNGVEILTYSVDCPLYSKQQKLSLENSARVLRYRCFEDALATKKCNKIATAHHLEDNTESVLINLFRGTGVKGMAGIAESDKIIRPLIKTSKAEILEYIKENAIPYVTDSTNACEDYTRNYLRINVLPLIRKAFPEVDNSIYKFSEIAKVENDFLDDLASGALEVSKDGSYTLSARTEVAILSRAIIKALVGLGVEKDWEKVHVDSVVNLKNMENGKKITLPKGVVAIKEYDKIVLYKEANDTPDQKFFSVGNIEFKGKTISVSVVDKKSINYKDGFYADLKKIPNTALVRTRKDGDIFTKFGGGTKSLGDYFTDIKIPLRLRDSIPLIADGREILAVCGYAVSEKVKVDDTTTIVVNIVTD